jgi:hypothetical protein
MCRINFSAVLMALAPSSNLHKTLMFNSNMITIKVLIKMLRAVWEASIVNDVSRKFNFIDKKSAKLFNDFLIKIILKLNKKLQQMTNSIVSRCKVSRLLQFALHHHPSYRHNNIEVSWTVGECGCSFVDFETKLLKLPKGYSIIGNWKLLSL